MLHHTLWCPVCQLKDLREACCTPTMSRLLDTVFLSLRALQLPLWVWQWHTTVHAYICTAVTPASCLTWLFHKGKSTQQVLNEVGSKWVHLLSSHFSATFPKMKEFFFTSAYGKIQQAIVDSNGSGCVPGSGHALGMDKAAVTKCGITFRNFEVPFGAWRRAARSWLCGPGSSVLEQPPHVLSSNIFQTLPWLLLGPHRPHSHQMNILASALVCWSMIHVWKGHINSEALNSSP